MGRSAAHGTVSRHELGQLAPSTAQRIYSAGASVLYLLDTPRRDGFNVRLKATLDELDEQEHLQFLQIGAYDGVHDDPIRHYFRNGLHWRGLQVEPQPAAAKQLEVLYGDRPDIHLRRSAVCSEVGTTALWIPNHAGHFAMNPLASTYLDKAQKGTNRLRGPKAKNDPGYRSQPVDTISVDDLLFEHQIEALDLLVTDTQGDDDYIVNGVLDKMLPQVILYEHNLMGGSVKRRLWKRLGEFGYKLTRSHKDTLAVVQ